MAGEENNDSSESEVSEVDPDVKVFTAAEVMRTGLLLVHYTPSRIRKAKTKVNVERFTHHFGPHPQVAALIFTDLQTTTVEEAYLPPADAKLDLFLMSLHALKKYPHEMEREPIFDISRAQGRDWVFYFLEKLQALKAAKICWPEDYYAGDIWVISVDGTHVWMNEPKHHEWSMDSAYFSHKHGKAGATYELGISLSENRLVWINGPFPAGQSDLKVFKKPNGLKKLLGRIGKRCIADGGYPGYPEIISTPNSLDSKEVAKFKSRALKRHETFNGLLKRYECLGGIRFRHGIAKFKTMFEAVCVICQYQIEKDPLYDILIEGVF